MVADWVANEVETVDFGDARLDRRYARILTALAAQPHASLPTPLGGRNELDAAYEFFDNPNVAPDEILSGRIEATHRRLDQVPASTRSPSRSCPRTPPRSTRPGRTRSSPAPVRSAAVRSAAARAAAASCI
ncbi:MAG: IS4/Tn5 family transposase DNA-binding protein [Planctomycetia bacterium]